MACGADSYREQAAAVAGWWIARRRRRGADPLGIRDLLDPAPATLVTDQQLPLWPVSPGAAFTQNAYPE